MMHDVGCGGTGCCGGCAHEGDLRIRQLTTDAYSRTDTSFCTKLAGGADGARRNTSSKTQENLSEKSRETSTKENRLAFREGTGDRPL